MRSAEPSSPRGPSVARDGGELTVAAAVSGIAAYVFITVGTRAYGATEFGPVSVLWTLWVGASAALTFPLQHWIIRAVERAGGHEADADALRRALLTRLPAVTVVLGVVLVIARQQLFLVDDLVHPLTATMLLPLSAVLGLARGLLGARRRFRLVAVSLLLENLARVVVLVALVLLDAPVTTVPLALLAGFAVIGLWPSALRPTETGTQVPGGLRSVASIAGGQVAAQMLLAGPPVLLAIRGGRPAEVTALFSAMALLRAPHLLLVGASPPVTAALVRAVGDDPRRTSTVRRALWAALLAAPVVAITIGPIVGWLLPTVFGDTVTLPRQVVVVATGGAWTALLTLLALLHALATGRGHRVTPAWAAAIVVGLPTLWIVGDPVLGVAWWLLVSEVAAFVALAIAGGQPRVGQKRASGAST